MGEIVGQSTWGLEFQLFTRGFCGKDVMWNKWTDRFESLRGEIVLVDAGVGSSVLPTPGWVINCVRKR